MADTFNVGVLLIPPTQLLDASPVDLFGMLTKDYLRSCDLPGSIVSLGVDVNIHYISPTGEDAEMTSQAHLKVTRNVESSDVAGGQLDVLFIPGPDPKVQLDSKTKEFIKSHSSQEWTTVIVVCTGIFPAGYSGILSGKNVTGPRALIPRLEKSFPDAKFLDQRWTQDGNLWCSGGITNGHDAVAAFLKQKFKGPLSNTVCALADVGDRDIKYDQTKVGMFGFFGWQVFKAWIQSFNSSKSPAGKSA